MAPHRTRREASVADRAVPSEDTMSSNSTHTHTSACILHCITIKYGGNKSFEVSVHSPTTRCHTPEELKPSPPLPQAVERLRLQKCSVLLFIPLDLHVQTIAIQ